jgi:hypothetical protein
MDTTEQLTEEIKDLRAHIVGLKNVISCHIKCAQMAQRANAAVILNLEDREQISALLIRNLERDAIRSRTEGIEQKG